MRFYPKLALLFLCLFYLSCNCLRFSKPYPINSKSLNEFPGFSQELFEGPFLDFITQSKKDSSHYLNEYLEVIKAKNDKWVFEIKEGIPKDDLLEDTLISQWYQLKIINSSLITLQEHHRLEIDSFYLDQASNIFLNKNLLLQIEFNFETKKGQVIEGKFPVSDHEIRFALSKHKHKDYYYLNFFDGSWLPYIFKEKDDGNISVWYLDVNEFRSNIEYYRSFTNIEKISNAGEYTCAQYLASPTDEEFFKIFELGSLFINEVVVKVSPTKKTNEQSSYTLYTGLGITAIIGVIFAFFKLKKKKQVVPKGAKRIFLSYSRKDNYYKTKLSSHLSPLIRENNINVWDDSNIKPGDNWKKEIFNKLDSSDIVILLVSANFINSDFCFSIEMQKAILNQKSGSTKVVPVIITPCLWQNTILKDLNVLPRNGKPISLYKNEDEIFVEIISEIKMIL